MSASPRAFATLLIALQSSIASAQAPVHVEPVESRSIVNQIGVTGTVTSPRRAVLSTAVAGLVAELTIDEGYRVEIGEPLLKLDSELAQLALERVEAEVRQRKIELDDAKRRFAEAEKVGAQRGVARTQIESLRAEVSSDEAALAAARAAAREQRAIVERHTLKAPFAGVISERRTELGEWVNPGDGLLELIATDNLRFDFRIGQQNFSVIAPGTPVEISFDALPGVTVPARVDTVVPIKNPGARTFLVRVLADDTDADAAPSITPGMSVRGTLRVDTGRSGITVSKDAILRFPDGRVTVWVIDDDGELPVVHERIVSTGFEFAGAVEVTSGLSPGDLVVVRGNETLQEGQTVSILDGTP